MKIMKPGRYIWHIFLEAPVGFPTVTSLLMERWAGAPHRRRKLRPRREKVH